MSNRRRSQIQTSNFFEFEKISRQIKKSMNLCDHLDVNICNDCGNNIMKQN